MPIASDTFYAVVPWPLRTIDGCRSVDVSLEDFRYGIGAEQLMKDRPYLLTKEEVNRALNGSDPYFAARVVGPHADCRIVPVTVTIGAPLELVEVPPDPPTLKYRLP
jgi:hypothetical protein